MAKCFKYEKAHEVDLTHTNMTEIGEKGWELCGISTLGDAWFKIEVPDDSNVSTCQHIFYQNIHGGFPNCAQCGQDVKKLREKLQNPKSVQEILLKHV